MRPPLFHLAAPLLALALAGCAGIQVDTDHDPAADFAAYRTYALLAPPPPETLLSTRIERALEEALQAEGLAEAPADEADLLVAHRVGLEQKVRVKDPYYAFKEVELYELKTLAVDLVDASTRRVVWTGTASTQLEEDATPEEREELVHEAVQKLFERYPPAD